MSCFKMSCVLLAGVLATSAVANAQEHRSAWMWSSKTSPYGAGKVMSDPLATVNMIRDFQYWGFDRIYATLSTNDDNIAAWNAGLDDVGIQSQSLMGDAHWIFPGDSRDGLLQRIQFTVIDFNESRADPREWVDAIHLDIEPHALVEWQTGTFPEQQEMLWMLSDTYAAVRQYLDDNGQSQVKLYADVPVWFDMAWYPEERDQWYASVGDSLDGISIMAYSRPSMTQIINDVQYEVDNFNGEVRIGLESASGPGETWATHQDLLDMADALEDYYGQAIGGIDFHPLIAWAENAEHAEQIPFIYGDISCDGYVGIDDLDMILSAWNQNVNPGTQLDPSGDGYVGLSDLNVILDHWNEGAVMTAPTVMVPEPAAVGIVLLAAVGLSRRL